VTAYQTEEEQIASIKRWWEANGKFVIIGGIIIIASVIGTRTWQNFELSKLQKVSAQYDLMMKELEDGSVDAVLQRGAEVIKNNPDLQYAVLTAMLVAKVEVEKGNNDAAVERLNWALTNTKSEQLKHIIRIRLAKVLLAQDKLDEALTYATFAQQDSFGSQYSIIQGDIYVKKGEIGSAKTAYTAALNDKTMGSQLRNFVQMKLDDLGNDEGGK
jgi:predicted negative regulator of RcsB-dependent stress response